MSLAVSTARPSASMRCQTDNSEAFHVNNPFVREPCRHPRQAPKAGTINAPTSFFERSFNKQLASTTPSQFNNHLRIVPHQRALHKHLTKLLPHHQNVPPTARTQCPPLQHLSPRSKQGPNRRCKGHCQASRQGRLSENRRWYREGWYVQDFTFVTNEKWLIINVHNRGTHRSR